VKRFFFPSSSAAAAAALLFPLLLVGRARASSLSHFHYNNTNEKQN
jgi:hypothetical protein